MLIYHTHRNGRSNISSNEIKSGKNCAKNAYKNRNGQNECVNRAKVVGGDSRKKKTKLRNKLSKKNKMFLNGIGLKVKQNTEN